MSDSHNFLYLVAIFFKKYGGYYILIAGSAWLLAYFIFRRRWSVRKINTHWPKMFEVWRESRWSLLTVIIYAIVTAIMSGAIRRGWGKAYFNISDYGWGWFVMSIVIAIVLHDTYFYWIHRLMHQKRIYRWFHSVHHLSANPSPWAAYAFSPLEALAHAGIAPLIFWLIPIHPLAFVIFMVFGLTWNIVVGHTGFEFFPRWWLNSWLGKCFITPTHHIMHHESFGGNYGHYFVFWDRLMGTCHQEYQKRFHEVVGREQHQAYAKDPHVSSRSTADELR